MRIINGILRGRRPLLPRNIEARPTTDMSREALFDILRNRVDFESIRVLDLFSGTGAVTYEFASLGSPDITAVERNRLLINSIRNNLTRFGIGTVSLIQADVFRYLARPLVPFDLIFADPPFDHPLLGGLPDIIFDSNLLVAPDGMFILEHGPAFSFSDHRKWKETRRYGKVNFSFFMD